MAFCKYCQGELPEDNTVCPACGKDNAAEPEAVEVAAEPEAEETPAVPEMAENVEAVTETEAAEDPAAAEGNDGSAEALAEEEEAVQDGEAKEPAPAKSKVGKIVGGLVALVALIAIVLFSIQQNEPTAAGQITDREVYAVEAAELTPDSDKVDKIVATIGDHELTNGVFQVYYWMQFYNMANSYGDYLTYMGLDTTIPFAEQDSGMPVNADATYAEVSSDEDALATLTWEQYFIQSAIACYEEYTALADAAEEAGLEMPEDYAETLASIPEDLAAQAEEAGYASADAFVQASFGTGATVDDYVAYMQTYLMAATYASDAKNVTGYTEADIEAYYDENVESYTASGIEKIDQNVISVRHILVKPEVDQDTDADEVNDASSESAWLAAEQQADQLYAQWQEDPTEENFATMATENSADTGSVSSGGLYEDVYPGQMVTEFNDWCFDTKRQSGDSAIVKTDYGYHIMYFVGVGDYVYWYQTAESDYINEIYTQRLDEVVDPVVAEVNFNNIYVNSLLDMVSE